MLKKSRLFAAAMALGFASGASASNDFSPCFDQHAFAELADSACATITTPLEATDPEGEKIELFVRKFPARSVSKGEIWLIAGGPGEAGSSYYADIKFFRDTFAGFDLMVPDHRGTGYSSKLCEPEETSDSEGGLALVGAEWGSCFGQIFSNTARAQAFSTANAAHDLNSLIGALGSSRKTYVYGVSYGTALALRFAEIATVKIDGIILDSLVSHGTDTANDLSHRSHTTDQVGTDILERCEADPNCALGSNARQTYAELLARNDAGETVTGLDSVPGGNLRQYLGTLVGSASGRKHIPAIIHALATGAANAGALIKDATSAYSASWAGILKFPQSQFSIPLSGLISGSEYDLRPDLTADELAKEEARLSFTSPLPGLLVNGNMPLYDKPESNNAPAVLPKIIVLQGTLDEKTPYKAAVNHIAKLPGRADIPLVTLTDAPHGVFFTAKECLKDPLQAFVAGHDVTSHSCSAVQAKLVFN